MNLVKFHHYERPLIRLNKWYLRLPKLIYEEIGSPERIDIYMDAKAKVIQIRAEKEGGFHVKTDKGWYRVNTNLSRVMSIGLYHRTKDNIFKLGK